MNIKKQRHYFANKGFSSQSYGFSRSHVWMWELDCQESWVPKKWCFWTVVLDKTLESPLDSKETQQSILKEISSVQSLSRVQLFVTPWTAARQASLSITNCWCLPKPMSIESVMPSNHLLLGRPLLLLPSIPPSMSLFQWVNSSHEVAKVLEFQLLHHSFQRTPRTDLLQNGLVGSLCMGLSRVFSNTTVQKHQFFGTQLSWQSNSHIYTWPLEKP